MSDWQRYVELRVKAKTGFGLSAIILGVITAIFGTVAIGFALAAAFIWLAKSYSPLVASLTLSGFFLLATIFALVGLRIAQRRTVERARLALAARNSAPWLDPRNLGIALQIGRVIGLRRIVPLLAAAALAVGLAKEWIDRNRSDNQDPENRTGT